MSTFSIPSAWARAPVRDLSLPPAEDVDPPADATFHPDLISNPTLREKVWVCGRKEGKKKVCGNKKEKREERRKKESRLVDRSLLSFFIFFFFFPHFLFLFFWQVHSSGYGTKIPVVKSKESSPTPDPEVKEEEEERTREEEGVGWRGGYDLCGRRREGETEG